MKIIKIEGVGWTYILGYPHVNENWGLIVFLYGQKYMGIYSYSSQVVTGINNSFVFWQMHN